MTTIIRRRTPEKSLRSFYPVFRSFHAADDVDHRKNFAPLNIIENGNVYKVELNVAGWQKEDIEVKIEDDTLIISGEKTTNSEEKIEYRLQEYNNQRFFRSVILSEEIDQENINAELKDGILTIELKKIPEDELLVSKKIEIQ